MRLESRGKSYALGTRRSRAAGTSRGRLVFPPLLKLKIQNRVILRKRTAEARDSVCGNAFECAENDRLDGVRQAVFDEAVFCR
jgi:hypothetical protein